MEQMSLKPTYEQVRDGLPNKAAREQWREADLSLRHARQAMQDVHDDESLSEEGKREKAQRVVDKYAERVYGGYAEARKKAEAAAESSWRFSVPMPGDHKTLATTSMMDSSEMVAVQNEADSLARRIEGKSLQQLTHERSKNPRARGIKDAGNPKLDELRKAFDEAMSAVGLEGKVKGLAVKRLCEETGVPLDDVVDHRTQHHHDAYLDAQRSWAAVYSIPSGRGMVENPYDGNRRGDKRRIGTYGSANKAVVSGGKLQPFQKKRRPPWK
jgi:hypothetical protein